MKGKIMQTYYPPTTINGLQQPGYMAKPNRSGGVDYFAVEDSGETNYLRPITREIFATNTGADLNLLEPYVAGLSTGGTTQSEATTSGGTTGGGGGSQSGPFQQVYNGQIYNDIQSYADAVNADINKKYNDSVKVINDNFQKGIINLDTRNSQIEATRTSLAEQHSANLGNIQGTFSKLSPEALQSAQSDFTNKIDTSFNQANAKLGSLPQNYRTMDQNQLAQFSDPNNPNYLTESGGLARDYANMVSGRQTDLQGANEWGTGQKNNIITNLLSQSDNYANVGDHNKSNQMSDFANYFAGMQFTPMQGMGATPSYAQVASDPNKKTTTPIVQYAGA